MTAVVARRGRRTGSVAWLVGLGIVLAALNLRTAVTSVGPVLDQVSAALGMSGVASGLLTTLPVLCFALFGAMTPALSHRVGEHRLLLAGLVLLGAGLWIRSVVGSSGVFLAASVLALSGGAIGNVLIPTLIKRHFPSRSGLMTTVYSTAMAAGTMLAAAATVPIQRAAGGNWHVALGVWAALAAVSAIPWLALLRSEPERHRARGTGPGELVRSRLAWAIATYFGTQSLIAYVMFGWLPQLLQDNGYTSAQAGTLLAVFTGLGIPISMLVPSIAARMADQRLLVAAFCGAYVIGFAGLLTGRALWVWAVLVGVGMGSFPLALAMLALRTRTAEATAALSAFGQSAGYLIAGAGPLAVGVLYELSGGWTVPFVLLFVVVGAQMVAGWYAGASRYIEDERWPGAPAEAAPDEGERGIRTACVSAGASQAARE
ncbi:CynX/NimT family MFS transporter [Microtetraspora malaysiensis]|uniref:CynX/NimT family MFS transporter n=1 Tax=Microtetraspora malaysiensis TaxID=161358 RepID=UPI000A0212EE|nr:MFS transporter [Microtetraspora malaysiensis]